MAADMQAITDALDKGQQPAAFPKRRGSLLAGWSPSQGPQPQPPALAEQMSALSLNDPGPSPASSAAAPSPAPGLPPPAPATASEKPPKKQQQQQQQKQQKGDKQQQQQQQGKEAEGQKGAGKTTPKQGPAKAGAAPPPASLGTPAAGAGAAAGGAAGAKAGGAGGRAGGRGQRGGLDKQVPLFAHLPPFEREGSLSTNVSFSKSEIIHPAVLKAGLMFADGTIVGANARCVAMLTAFKAFIKDYVCPPEKSINRDLDKQLGPQFDFLTRCRPHSFSMGNAHRKLRKDIAHLRADISLDEAREEMCFLIDRFIEERVRVADDAIVNNLIEGKKIVNGDVILTYARSHVVEKVLKAAHERGIEFRVIVGDGRPRLEGRELLRRLQSYGIKCTYIMLNGLAYVMKDVTKVLLGAAAFTFNGAALSRVGTAMVSMVAHEFSKPVLFACETYKFCQRVQIDSIVYNELGDPDLLISGRAAAKNTGDAARPPAAAAAATPAAGKAAPAKAKDAAAATAETVQESPLQDWRDIPGLRLLNLNYDLTPVEHVTLVATELGIIPPTSIPVIIRERQDDPHDEEDVV